MKTGDYSRCGLLWRGVVWFGCHGLAWFGVGFFPMYLGLKPFRRREKAPPCGRIALDGKIIPPGLF